MVRGKQTCKILKDIRRQIAEANDIEYITSECQYKGDCTGTCPKCEAEVQYLEQQLARKHMAGKAITILGVSAGLATMMPQPACAEPIHSEAPHGGKSDHPIRIVRRDYRNECLRQLTRPVSKEHLRDQT